VIATRTIARGVFVTGTSTGVGKTFVARGLARALLRRGVRVAAVKPIETGCAPDPRDAIALARACGRPELASALGFYRGTPPLSPRAIVLEGGQFSLDAATLAASVEHAAAGSAFAIVEGAGGLFVPLTRFSDLSELVTELGLPALLVARDRLGALSDVLAVVRAAPHETFSHVILSRRPEDRADPSQRSNATILAERGLDVAVFERCADDDDALADEAERSGLVEAVLSRTPPAR
jgi:dethiobiotin synthetase